jgi:hypothetical protein
MASMSPPIWVSNSGAVVVVQRAGDRLGQGLGHVLIVFGMALADVAAGQAHVHAHGPQVQDFFPRHLVRHDQDQLVALQRRHLGEAQAGIAGRRLDDGAAGLEPAVLLGRSDHRAGDAVLDRAARVLVFQLQEQAAKAGVEVPDLNHRGVADQLKRGPDDGRKGGGRKCGFGVVHGAAPRPEETISPR